MQGEAPNHSPLSRICPPRPTKRPAPSRYATLCFWTVLFLFLAAIVVLGMLAYSRNEGQAQPESDINGHVYFGLLLVGFAIAAIVGVISSRHHNHHL